MPARRHPAKGRMNEKRLLDFLQRRYKSRGRGVATGIGDDAAVVRSPGAGADWVVTTDMLVEDVDFRRGWLTAGQLGWKSLATNLSDLAAMGARPRFFLAALAFPKDLAGSWVRRFYRGMDLLSERHGISLVGGDLSRSPAGIQVTVTAIGETRRNRPALRSGARAGDRIFVTGTLGLAAAGLHWLATGRGRPRTPAQRAALERFRTPEPRCDAGLWLAARGFPSAMMDLSDGLSTDLGRLCRSSGLGAEVWEDSLPLCRDTRGWGCNPRELALHGGEDFELLFCVPELSLPRLGRLYPASLPPIRCIGRMGRGRGIRLASSQGSAARILPQRGFDHFESRQPAPAGSR